MRFILTMLLLFIIGQIMPGAIIFILIFWGLLKLNDWFGDNHNYS